MSIGPVPVILLVAVGVGWAAANHVAARAPAAWRRGGLGLVGLGVLLVLWVGLRVATDTNPLAAGMLDRGAGELDVPGPGAVSLVVHGTLPTVGPGESAHGSVTLAVTDAAGHHDSYRTELEEHWESRRASRKGGKVQVLMKHDEQRVDLDHDVLVPPIHVSVADRDGEIVGPVSIEAVPSPPGIRLVLALAALLALAGTSFDVFTNYKTVLGVASAGLGVFACTLLQNVTPHGPGTAVIGAAMISVIGGPLAAGVLRVVASAVRPSR